ncbi:MAG: preprotein translocase subunit YajC [Deltaproteobacteria bacterium]|nr:preprotein translocase subunit YajC [Deltaproteobacteria bacterium]MBW2076895.1 preprotein translocase subunit YajC [Deltaproteobacteria bacterium]MBW2309989.1 preprotein translocase subunit YajC [Deltaproteobacteria bacterium]RLB27987.1 MAG: preprotein translocase subunit YajC [Deltaproteobacteria bacterium]
MFDLAYAMGTGGAGGGTSGGGFGAFVPLIIIFAIFYFLLIRPQQKKAKQHKQLLSALKKGDRVVSSGGLHGLITGLSDDVVTMEISPKVRVKVSRGSIAGVSRKAEGES